MAVSEGLRRCSVLPELMEEGMVATVEDIWTESSKGRLEQTAQY